MRVEYTRPATDESESASDRPDGGRAAAGRDQQSPQRGEDEQPGGESRPTVG
jgi:hypothetical protein